MGGCIFEVIGADEIGMGGLGEGFAILSLL
jgi:hypothetical protein